MFCVQLTSGRVVLGLGDFRGLDLHGHAVVEFLHRVVGVLAHQHSPGHAHGSLHLCKLLLFAASVRLNLQTYLGIMGLTSAFNIEYPLSDGVIFKHFCELYVTHEL